MGNLTVKYTQSILGTGFAKIFIDDEKVSEIFMGEVKTFNLSKGKHTLQIKQLWICSPKIELEITDDQKHISFRDSYWRNLVTPVALLFMLIHFLIAEPAGFHYLEYLMIPAIIAILYILIFELNKFYVFENIHI